MQSNEPINKKKDENKTNPYLSSVIGSLGMAGATEGAAHVARQITKRNPEGGMYKVFNSFLYEKGVTKEQLVSMTEKASMKTGGLIKVMPDEKAEKIANNKMVNFFTSGASTAKGRINAYGLGTLAGLLPTFLIEHNKNKEGAR